LSAVTYRAPRRAARRDLALLWHQIRYEQLTFWRNPQSAFFTFLLPVVIITFFGVLFHGGQKSSYFYGLSPLQYYVSTIAAVSVLGSCYSQLAIVLAMRRHDGILKRVRATPLPAWAYFLGLLAHCILVSVIDVVLIVAVGRLFGVPLPTAAPAVVQFVLFPLIFVSGSYLPIHSQVLNRITGALPVRPFNQALIGPFAQHTGFDWKDLGVLLAWGVVGAVVAIRRFRWDPR
jgi:ABC-2 type transport system permease protein